MSRKMLKYIFQWYNTKSCIQFDDVTDTLDLNDPGWPMKHGYSINSYVYVTNLNSCSANGGGPVNGSRLQVSPCDTTYIIQHEMGHIAGWAHVQQGFDQHLRIAPMVDSLDPAYLGTYAATNPNITNDVAYDEQTTLHYITLAFTRNGEAIYICIEPYFCDADSVVSSDTVFIRDINTRYNCNALVCNNNPTYCGLGYYARYNNICQCVCPREYNSTTNCAGFISGPDTTLQWPNAPFGLIGAGSDFSCPAGFNPTGWITFTGTYAYYEQAVPVSWPKSQSTIYLPVCTRTTPTTNIDWYSFPVGGRFCVLKPLNNDCGGPFSPYFISMQAESPIQSNGSLGGIIINGNNLTLPVCCKNLDNPNYQIELPNDKPFQLFAVASCPIIKGMRCYSVMTVLYASGLSAWGSTVQPLYAIFSGQLQIIMCYCMPPTYGTSYNVTLTTTNRSVNITTPGYPGSRTANSRAFYCATSPPGSIIRVTFNDYSLDTDDKFLVKIFNPYNEPHRLDNTNPPAQLLSETNYACLEFWSGYKSVKNKGVSFTFDIVLASEFCYNTTLRGQDYMGSVNISKTYEPCLNWADTVDCYNSPYNDWDAITGYFDGNSCRNPGGAQLMPWCYTSVNGSNCVKRHCDVCGSMKTVDVLPASVCTNGINTDPNFCTTSLQKYGCYKSCKLYIAPPLVRNSCGSPPIPIDGVLLSLTGTKLGDRAYIGCKNTFVSNDVPAVMLCKSSGWTQLNSGCGTCPAGWTIYGQICMYISTTTMTRRAAETFCRAQGRNGTLMRVTNQADQLYLRSWKILMKASGNAWISGNQCSSGKWCFTDSSTAMTYYNWTSDTNPTAGSTNCVYIYKETTTASRGGGWSTCNCDDTSTSNLVVCQMDAYSTSTTGLADSATTCQDALADNARFCSDSGSVTGASNFCTSSCGLAAAPSTCSVPPSSSYTYTSPNPSVYAGDAVKFTCSSQYFYVSGAVYRACGNNGLLLGTPIVCSSNPSSVTVAMYLVSSRATTLPAKQIVCLDQDRYRVPINGNIATWYYYCENAGDVSFLAYRKSGSSYNHLGTFTTTCVPDRIWSCDVPAANQISVQTGDVIAVYSAVAGTISMTDCGPYSDKILMPSVASASNLTVAQTTTRFPTQSCMVPAVSYRVVTT